MLGMGWTKQTDETLLILVVLLQPAFRVSAKTSLVEMSRQ